ncbi:hypothetical protein F5Y04DRAFT_5244 [Hypomontagnella monticulosa]|nr:hypothetical protein F5Y04DRAFT_5244 [Hypomontagnella monticulosa]
MANTRDGKRPRLVRLCVHAATLQDTVYIDGGYMKWVRGMMDGSTSTPVPDTNPLGLIYTYNFSKPFDATTNFSTLLGELSKDGTINAPNYYDGALLANDHEFFLYGGELDYSSSYPEPDGNTIIEYAATPYGEVSNFRSGFLNKRLSDRVSQFIAYGAGANAPSENKAWYFGGYQSESGGPLYASGSNASYATSNVSDFLITLDMADQGAEAWTNATLQPGTNSRANPSVVWVPVGEQGILVVIGGVTYANYTEFDQLSPNPAQSRKDASGFMHNIDIYDIASKKWYQQPADGAPPGLAMGCAVLGTAADYSSFNIYYYGGYDGLDLTTDFNDDVWILSLPSFMWMKVTSGRPGHGRAGHYCVTPYPDQMISIGGQRNFPGDQERCLDGDVPGIFQVYNMTSGRWQDSYDPNSWNNYGVPEMIHQMIGGDFSGGATMTTPSASGWATTELAGVFATPYPTSKLTTYYPYASMGPGNGTRGQTSGGGGGGGGTPSYLGPVLGVVLGLAFVTAIVVAIILYRKKKLFWARKKDGSEQTDEHGNRVWTWVKTQHDGKDPAPTITTSDETRTQLGDLESRGFTPARSPGISEAQAQGATEMEHTPLVELDDTSPRQELQGSPHPASTLVPIPEHNKHSPYASHPQTPHSIFTPTSQTFVVASHDHVGPSSHSPQPPTPDPEHRPDSPPLGSNDAHFGSIASATNPTPNRNAVVSGVSGLSDRAAGHLRQISDATVSSARTGDSSHTIQADTNNQNAPQQPSTLSHQIIFAPPSASNNSSPPLPVSPPSADGGQDSTDYMSLSHRGAGSPLRRSVFREDEVDLGAGEGEGAGEAPERR